MSASVESPVHWRKAAEHFATNGLFRSRSTHFDLVANASSRLCASEVPNSAGVGQRQTNRGLMVNGVGCSPSASPSCRRRFGLSSHLNKFCHQLQFNVSSLAIPSCLRSDRNRLLSQSSEALSSLQVQTAPVTAPKPAPDLQKTPDAAKKCAFSAPVSGAAATVLVGAGIHSADDGSIPSVRCELVAGLVNECSVVDQLLVIDCRSFVAYNSNHVHGALNISCADCISRKRLLTGRVTIGDLVSGSDDAKDRYQRAAEVVKSGNKNAVQVIVYDEDTINFDDLQANSPLRLVVSCLVKTGFDVYYMFGGLKAFHKDYGKLCSQPGVPLNRPVSCCRSPASDGRIDDAQISEILPFLFVGNDQDAANRSVLCDHKISHVINVTSHVPLHFESDGVKYLRFPAADSGIQNLRQYFEEAIMFIDKVYGDGGHVLIHCQAGVSRSSTLAIAYIMARSDLAMLDAFRFVKSRRSIVAPNFNFMGQLLEFETALKHSRAGALKYQRDDVMAFISDWQQRNPLPSDADDMSD